MPRSPRRCRRRSVRVDAVPGARVRKGDTLLILEAMKMELPIRAPADGVVRAVHCREGELVTPGVALVDLDHDDGATP